MATLARVLGSGDFDASERRRKLLCYIVEQMLDGRADRLKAYSLAVDVLGRGSDFDPQSDPIVRIEMGRLRQNLAHYYAGDGRDDPLRILIPKGNYVPVFQAQAAVPDVAPPTPPVAARNSTRRGPGGRRLNGRKLAIAAAVLMIALSLGSWLLVGGADRKHWSGSQDIGPALVLLPFDNLSGDEEGRLLANGLETELIDHLMRFDGLKVFAGAAAPAGGIEAPPLAESSPIAFLVSGSVRREASWMRVTAMLTERASGQVLWSRRLDRSLSTESIADVETELAGGIVGELAQPYGIIARAAAQQLDKSHAATLYAYDCVQRAFAYRHAFARELYAAVRTCLEEAVRRDPGYANAWAMLAFAHLDAARFGFVEPGAASDEMAAGLQAAEVAVTLAPGSVRSLQSLAALRFMNGDYDEAERIQRLALALNPDDPETLAQLGWRLMARSRWDEAVLILQAAIDHSVHPPAWYYSTLGEALYLAGDLARARDIAELGKGDCCGIGQAGLAITEAALGHEEAARAAIEEALRQAPLLRTDPKAFWGRLRRDEQVSERLAAGLRKAGLQVADRGRP